MENVASKSVKWALDRCHWSLKKTNSGIKSTQYRGKYLGRQEEKHKDEIDENTNLYIVLSITTKRMSVLLL